LEKAGAEDENLSAFSTFMHAWVAAEKEVARLSKVIPVASNKLTPQWQLKVRLISYFLCIFVID
jgi:hypothetical protein